MGRRRRRNALLLARGAAVLMLLGVMPACDGGPTVGRDSEPGACKVVSGLVTGEPLRGAVEVAAHRSRACARLSDGRVVCWGDWARRSGFGCCEPNSEAAPTLARPVAGLGRTRAISLGEWGACAVTEAGQVRCWESFAGEMEGVRAIGALADAVDVAGGLERGCALTKAHEVRCWGVWGGGVVPREPTADPVAGGTDVLALAVDEAGCFLRDGGEIRCFSRETGAFEVAGRVPGAVGLSADWGVCAWDALGSAFCLDDATTESTRREGVDATLGIVGAHFSCAHGADRYLRCDDPSGRSSWDLAALGPITSFALGSFDFGCAVGVDGDVVCWGDGSVGALGDGAQPYTTVPVVNECAPEVRAVAAGATSTCVVDERRRVSCAGAEDPVLRPVPALEDTAILAAGGDLMCGLSDTGALTCVDRRWRRGKHSGAPGGVDETTLPPLQFGAGARQIALGSLDACVLRADGGVDCAWVDAEVRARRGDGLTRIGGVAGALQIGLGAQFGCARLATGEIACWGTDEHGERGRGCPSGNGTFGWCGPEASGDLADRHGTATVVPGVADAIDLAVGAATACVVRRDGGVWCWGHECYRPYGSTDQATFGAVVKAAPAPVDDAVDLEAGPSCRFCATRTDGTVVCFGDGYVTEPFLADNTTSPSPELQRVTGLRAPRQMSVGYLHTCAITEDDRLHCWGYGAQGQLVDGLSRWRAQPSAVRIAPGSADGVEAP